MERQLRRLTRVTLAAVIAATAVAAFVLWHEVVRDLLPYEAGVRIPWYVLAACFACTELFVVHAHVRGSAHSLSLSELPLVLGLLLAEPERPRDRDGRRACRGAAVHARPRDHPPGLQPRAVRPHRRARDADAARAGARAGGDRAGGVGRDLRGGAGELSRGLGAGVLRDRPVGGRDPVAPAGEDARRRPRGRAHELERRAVGRHDRRPRPARRLAADPARGRPPARLPRLRVRARQAPEPGVPLRRDPLALARA